MPMLYSGPVRNSWIRIAARGKIDLRKTAFVIGDLSSAALAIEEGAYFKGSIEIIRDSVTAQEASPRSPAAGAVTRRRADPRHSSD